MEWSILFMGPVGAGKTQAIRTLSDIETVDTDVQASGWAAVINKPQTTVTMDAGMLELGQGDRVRLLGAPGQDRFDFMWDILLTQAHAVVLLIDHSQDTRQHDLDHFIRQIGSRVEGRRVPLIVGITHVDLHPSRDLESYRRRIAQLAPTHACGVVPIFPVDARNVHDMRTLVISVAAMLEMEQRFGPR
jgi:signal recognition particle receptor subunit beta